MAEVSKNTIVLTNGEGCGVEWRGGCGARGGGQAAPPQAPRVVSAPPLSPNRREAGERRVGSLVGVAREAATEVPAEVEAEPDHRRPTAERRRRAWFGAAGAAVWSSQIAEEATRQEEIERGRQWLRGRRRAVLSLPCAVLTLPRAVLSLPRAIGERAPRHPPRRADGGGGGNRGGNGPPHIVEGRLSVPAQDDGAAQWARAPLAGLERWAPPQEPCARLAPLVAPLVAPLGA